MRRLRGVRIGAALALLAFTGAGCAAHWAYRGGQAAAEDGDWDMAVAKLTRALDKDPRNVRYKIALETARVQASRFHYDQARKHLAANDLEKAADELQIASNYDPSNRSAADDLLIVRKRIEKQQAEQRERSEFEQTKARGEAAARLPEPVLAASSNVRIPMVRFESESLQKILEALGKLAKVNVLFDESFRDKKTSFTMVGLSFQDLLDRVTKVNRLFYKVLDENTILVVPESRQNRLKYDEIMLRTFYLQNAEVDETANMIKQIAKVTTIASNKALGAITILGTLDQIAIGERIIQANDKARGEVVVEVEILEVRRGATRQWGLNISSYGASAQLAPFDSGLDSTGASAVSSLRVRGYLLSSLNQADWIVTIPSQIFAQFVRSSDNTRILAAPRLRAAEGKKTELRIGEEVPIPVTTFGVAAGATGQLFPSTSFQYRNVGVNMNLTPRVAASGDVTLEIVAEFSLIGGERNIGDESREQLVPTFLTRNVNAILRLRDGETGLIGGLLQGREARTFAGALGSLPVIGKLLGSRTKTTEDTEILISVTPHIVRAPKLTEEDFIPLHVGTQEVPHVRSVRERAFGPEPEATPAPGGDAKTTPEASRPPSEARPDRPQGLAPDAVEPGPVPSAPPGDLEPGATGAPPAEPLGPPTTLAPPTVPPTGAQPVPPAAASPAPEGPAVPPQGAAPASPPGTMPPAPQPAGAPPAALLNPPEVSLRVGQSAGLALVLVGAKGVQWVEMTLVFDPALAELTDLAAGALLTLDGSPVQAERTIEPTGRARVRFSRSSPVVGSGAVAAITLKGLKPGSGTLVVESLRTGRADVTETPPVPAAGRLVVTP